MLQFKQCKNSRIFFKTQGPNWPKTQVFGFHYPCRFPISITRWKNESDLTLIFFACLSRLFIVILSALGLCMKRARSRPRPTSDGTSWSGGCVSWLPSCLTAPRSTRNTERIRGSPSSSLCHWQLSLSASAWQPSTGPTRSTRCTAKCQGTYQPWSGTGGQELWFCSGRLCRP